MPAGRGRDTVFADVAHHEPAAFLGLVEQHVQGEPCTGRLEVLRNKSRQRVIRGNCSMNFTCRQEVADSVSGIIVAVAGPVKPIRSELVPFFTRHLAGFAADADCRVREEARRRPGLRRNTRRNRVDEASEDRRQQAAGGSLVCGNAANSISLLAMSKPPRRLRSRWRIRDRVRRGGDGCNRQRYGRPHVLEPTRAQLADKGFSAVDVGIRVERER